MTRVDTIAETELEPFMLPSIDTVAAGGSDATQKTNAHADSCIRRQFSIKRKVCGSELLTSSLTKCFFLFLFILAACGHNPFSEMKAESVCPKDELNEGAVNRVDQSERNAEIGAPESECWRWSGGGGSGFSGFAGLDSEQPVDRNVNTDSEC